MENVTSLKLFCFDFESRIMYFNLSLNRDGFWLLEKGTKSRSIAPAVIDFDSLFETKEDALRQVIGILNTMEVFNLSRRTPYTISSILAAKSSFSIYTNQAV
jgi:hypothetical protein